MNTTAKVFIFIGAAIALVAITLGATLGIQALEKPPVEPPAPVLPATPPAPPMV